MQSSWAATDPVPQGWDSVKGSASVQQGLLPLEMTQETWALSLHYTGSCSQSESMLTQFYTLGTHPHSIWHLVGLQ